jgi:hypothetical protein
MSQAAAAPRRVFVVGVGMTKFEKVSQRVLNDLKRARLSRGRMIWLLAHPVSPPLKGRKGVGRDRNY